jgi:phosphatidylinositol alpha-mannosyltransferase
VKIAIICPYDFSRPGGVQAHIRDLSRELRKNENQVTIVAPNIARSKEGFDHDLELFGNSISVNFNKTQIDISLAWGREYKRMKDWFLEQQFDVIHFHTIWNPFLSFQILSLADKSARVATFHDTPPETFTGYLTRKFFRLLSRFIYSELDCITAVSQSPAQHLYNDPDHPIHILPPSIDYSRFFRIPRDTHNRKISTILFIGRLDPRKGVLTLLRAYQNLKQQGEKIKLVVAGDGRLFNLLRKKIKDNKIRDVSLLGYICEREKHYWLSQADVFCAPALYGESFGIVIVEAMAAGVPIVGAANSGYSMVLEDQSDLCLSIPGDPTDLAQKLKFLLNNAKHRQYLTTWGRQQAVQYDVKAWQKKWSQLYMMAVKQRKKK